MVTAVKRRISLIPSLPEEKRNDGSRTSPRPYARLADGDTTQTHQSRLRIEKATRTRRKTKVTSRECHVPRTWRWGLA